jgi:hypothetical protein
VLNTAVGGWDHSHGTSFNSPNALVQKLCSSVELLAFESFNLGYNTAGLFGYYVVSRSHF